MAIKRVLITGSNSYVGTNVEKWLMKEPDKFYVETISVRGDAWKSFDFSKFDVVFHVAGIAHVSPKKSMKKLYYAVNRDLAIGVAKKAKESGVGQFIFMSSMIVYSSKETRITKDTITNPDNFYGKSKLEAEKVLSNMQNFSFKVLILRSPVIYGKFSKGNFNKLKNLSKIICFFPKFNSKKSVLFIDHLSLFIHYSINHMIEGIHYPHNDETLSVYMIIKRLHYIFGIKGIYPIFFNNLIALLTYIIPIFKRVFKDFYYETPQPFDYQILGTLETIDKTFKDSE